MPYEPYVIMVYNAVMIFITYSISLYNDIKEEIAEISFIENAKKYFINLCVVVFSMILLVAMQTLFME
jgi:hypothetical protein